MQSFREVYAAAAEVKCVDDALAVIVEHRWSQKFGLGGDVVFWLCMQGGVVCLTCALFQAPQTLLFPRLVRALSDACIARGIPLNHDAHH
jgi:hypothetical protein